LRDTIKDEDRLTNIDLIQFSIRNLNFNNSKVQKNENTKVKQTKNETELDNEPKPQTKLQQQQKSNLLEQEVQDFDKEIHKFYHDKNFTGVLDKFVEFYSNKKHAKDAFNSETVNYITKSLSQTVSYIFYEQLFFVIYENKYESNINDFTRLNPFFLGGQPIQNFGTV
jgi:hypothetical protein